MKQLFVFLGILMFKFSFAQEIEMIPHYIDSLLLNQYKVCEMFKSNYDGALIGDSNETIGSSRLTYYTDPMKKTLFKVVRRDSTISLRKYIILFYVDNKLVKSEDWEINTSGAVLNHFVSYYLNGKLVFPGPVGTNGIKRESFVYLSKEYLIVLIGKSN